MPAKLLFIVLTCHNSAVLIKIIYSKWKFFVFILLLCARCSFLLSAIFCLVQTFEIQCEISVNSVVLHLLNSWFRSIVVRTGSSEKQKMPKSSKASKPCSAN